MMPDQSASEDTIDRAFERQAALTPAAVAVQLGSSSITYRELDVRSDRLAQRLRAYIREPDTFVAICCERSIEMIVAMLATLKAGAAYLPIDPSNPRDRIELVLADAAPALILTHAALADSLPRTAIPTISVDTEPAAAPHTDVDRGTVRAQPPDLAYLIYTSGSTGKPKGVMVTHRNFLGLLSATNHWFNFNPDDVWTLFHSAAFDFSVWEIWGCLLTGGRLVIVPLGVIRSPAEFYELLESERVTVLNQTPSAFYQIVHVDASRRSRALALRYVIFGGEALNFAALQPWFERHGDIKPRLINMYGITETTVHVTYRPVSARDAREEVRSLIGEPIPDLRMYLLDESQRPVAPGEIGEIYVGGRGVARGYLSRPELSSERFLADPFAARDGERMYRSGDLARRLDNGDIEYLGRGDSQVKIRGFRIELGEIEATLAQHPGVRQAVVVARSEAGTDRLVAYFAQDSGRPTTAAALRAFLRTKLPEHMVPYAYVGLEAFPLTVNGKIDRNALPAPRDEVIRGPVGEVASTPLEHGVMALWRKTLSVEHIGLDDSFFDLGGTSLLLVIVHAGLESTLQTKIPMTDLFEFPTVRSLARHLAHRSTMRSFPEVQQRAQKQRVAYLRHQRRQSGSIA